MKLVKKIMGVAVVLLSASVLLCSCQSTKTSDEKIKGDDSVYIDSPADDEIAIKSKADKAESDETEAETVAETESEDVEEADDPVNTDADSYEADVGYSSGNEKKKDNSFLSFLTNQSNPRFKDAGTFTLSTPAINRKLKKQEATFYIDNKNYNAGFGSPILAAYYIVLMDKKMRSVFTNAVNSYLSDFENKKLTRKDKKSIKKYGKSKATLYWGVLKSQTSNYGYSDAYFGYTFKENSPYFTITIYPTVNEKRWDDDTVAEESMTLNYYFTKAQSKALVDFLNEDNLNNYFENIIPKVEAIETDEY